MVASWRRRRKPAPPFWAANSPGPRFTVNLRFRHYQLAGPVCSPGDGRSPLWAVSRSASASVNRNDLYVKQFLVREVGRSGDHLSTGDLDPRRRSDIDKYREMGRSASAWAADQVSRPRHWEIIIEACVANQRRAFDGGPDLQRQTPADRTLTAQTSITSEPCEEGKRDESL